MPYLPAIIPAIVLALAVVPNPDRLDCAGATANYEVAVKKLREALTAYQHCIEASRARDKCASEMEALGDLHEEFEDAVSDHADVCR
jgi:hypothetical protein